MAQDATAIRVESVPAERILLVEDDPGLQRQMHWALEPCVTTIASTREEAIRQFKLDGDFRVVILDLGLPPDRDGATEGLKTLEEILVAAPQTKVIVVSGQTDRSQAVKAVGKGAFDFIAKPIDIDVLKLIIQRARRMHALEEENRALRDAPNRGLPNFVYASAEMEKVRRLIERVGPSDISVLISGETGTGKEVVARALHEVSPRHSGPYVAINCASIPSTLLESELFGHERGAFTGAIKQTPGRFEMANKGTLFLDEIGDMPLDLQSKVLRFLQERQFERVGGRTPIKVNVRVLAATNKPLEALIEKNEFRQDLFFRLSEVPIGLPPVREREGDAVVLAHHFLNIFNRAHYRDVRGFSSDAITAISHYNWPGNVRELENRIKRAVIMAEGKLITAADLDLASLKVEERTLNLRKETQKLERTLAQEALARSQGNMSKAAKLLGVSRPYLYTLTKSKQQK